MTEGEPLGLWPEGFRHLAEDPAFGPWVRAAGPVDLEPSHLEPFAHLVRSIVFQQLAAAAASAIHGRVVAALGGAVDPAAVCRTAEVDLRAAGLSASKLRAIRDLATRVDGGQLRIDATELAGLDDQAVVERLTQVWGIGRWTAQMFLMFRLARPDVWPVGDLAVRVAWARIHALDERPTARELEPAADHLRPWRSAATWYCWRALELADSVDTNDRS